jgi:murein DD-endopeptidase MepM/ murein hydrolase activator NlpD
VPPDPRIHVVEPGDTLSSLSRRYRVSVNDFVVANNLADPNALNVGDRLIIPSSNGAGTWAWPVTGPVVSGFGVRRGVDTHRGLDIDADAGDPVVAAWSGVVVYSGSDMSDYGSAIIINHGGGLTSLYGHNSELLVREGDRVERGQPIALAGRTGNATGVHCHFEIRRNAEALNPMQFLTTPSR